MARIGRDKEICAGTFPRLAFEGLVLGKAHCFLTGIEGLAANEAVRWTSLLGDLQVCQVVDPLKTMRFPLPRMPLRRQGALSR